MLYEETYEKSEIPTRLERYRMKEAIRIESRREYKQPVSVSVVDLGDSIQFQVYPDRDTPQLILWLLADNWLVKKLCETDLWDMAAMQEILLKQFPHLLEDVDMMRVASLLAIELGLMFNR